MPTCGAENLPEVDFDFCNPLVALSEIKRIFIALTGSAPFVDWSDANAWNSRISQTDNDINSIRVLVCTGDKPKPNSTRKDISNNRKVTTLKEHTINATIDEVNDIMHDFIISLKVGRYFRLWYETHGGYMFGGNAGMIVFMTGEMVLPRGGGEIMTYELTAIWKNLKTEDRILSPIFDDMPVVYEPLLNEDGTPLLNEDGSELLRE